MQAGVTSRYWYEVDGRSNVIALTDSTGNTVDRYQYDLWGKLVSSSESVPQRLRYAGHDPAYRRWRRDAASPAERGNPHPLEHRLRQWPGRAGPLAKAMLLHTSDGGATWQTQTGSTDLDLLGLAVADPLCGRLVGRGPGGLRVHTTSGPHDGVGRTTCCTETGTAGRGVAAMPHTHQAKN